MLGVLVMAACIFIMGRMMGHGGSKHSGHGGTDHDESRRSAQDILAERFARGEVSQEEFEERRRVLASSGNRPHAAE